MKKKLITILISTITTSALAAGTDVKPWSESDLASYVAGSKVTENGELYECKNGPAAGWCQLASYEPTSQYGSDA